MYSGWELCVDCVDGLSPSTKDNNLVEGKSSKSNELVDLESFGCKKLL